MGYVTYTAIAILFFLYGARLSPGEIRQGLLHWRLQSLVLACTYFLFPLVGVSLTLLAGDHIPESLRVGLVYLSVLPSTVQSSIAFTSIARGNVAAALTCASISNLAGVFVTPIMVGLLLNASGQGIDLTALRDIATQLLAPFIFGQIARPWVGDWLKRNKRVMSFFDRGSILLVVYVAFGEGMVAGVWSRVSVGDVLVIALLAVVLLAIVMTVVRFLGRVLGFNRDDRIAILFCGSKKSLATGIPMASILFAGQGVPLIVLPLMVFHQLQLFVCAILAQRFAAQSEDDGGRGSTASV